MISFENFQQKHFKSENIHFMFEIFHLLMFCPETLLGLIGKKDLNHPSAASRHSPATLKISAPVTTQYNVNVRVPTAQGRWGLVLPMKGSSHSSAGHAARPSWDVLSSEKKNFCCALHIPYKVFKTQRCISQLSGKEQGLEPPIPQNLQRCPAGAEGGPSRQRSPRAL